METYASLFEIRGGSAGATSLVRVHMDGSVTYGPGFTTDTAAKEFWEAVRKLVPPAKHEIITHERALDLVRHQRHELHEAGLINDEEYAYLVSIPGSVARLEHT